jgi:hypothetical protein
MRALACGSRRIPRKSVRLGHGIEVEDTADKQVPPVSEAERGREKRCAHAGCGLGKLGWRDIANANH